MFVTTIVATRRAMYSDSQLNTGDVAIPVIKLFRIPGGGLLGTAGDSRLTELFERAMRAGQRPEIPDAGEDEYFQGVLVDRTGLYYFDKFFARYQVHNADFVCIGSGGMVAKSWMLAGATPEEAMKKAMQVDPQTGGAVQSLGLSSPSVRRKR